MERFQEKIGCHVHIPNVGRGKLKYIGPVEGKPGIYAGVDLLANIGKNNGSYKDHKYFQTEYPLSGLFVQLEKLIPLIENTQNQESRRSTLTIEPYSHKTGLSEKNRLSSSDSTETIILRPLRASNQASPTPIKDHPIPRNDHMLGHEPYELNLNKHQFNMESNSTPNSEREDVLMSVDSRLKKPSISSTPSSRIYKEQDDIIERQEREILQYKKLLNEQRAVLEEMQPTIEDYEKNMRFMELEIKKLHEQLNTQQEQQEKQKEFFEDEHEQLLAVVEELHQQMKFNERYFRNNSETIRYNDLRDDTKMIP